ncbi:MAG: sulfurtransferase TusA family protein [Bdellovibrionota bacterium]
MAVREVEVPKMIWDEIDYFATEVDRFKKKQVDEEKFKGFRLHHGIYGQRQAGVQMVRIKIPYGALNPDQLERIAEIGETYTDGILHTTTRQDIQLHWVKLDDVVDIMKGLAKVGLGTREACGNSVRNVTATPFAGVHPKEAFDVTPYAHAVAHHLMRHELTQHLPRKFKVAFSGSYEDDGGIVAIHDIGAIAVMKDGKKGFALYGGGGLGATPVLAEKVADFIPASLIMPACEGLVLIHHHHSNRKNRMQARMKFVLKDWGLEKFRARWQELYEERKALWMKEHGEKWEPAPVGVVNLPAEKPFEWKPNGDAKFHEWLQTSILPQKQEGYSLVNVRLERGDFTSAQARQLAGLCRKYMHDSIRITQDQNLLLRGVRTKDLKDVYQGLGQMGLAATGALRLRNILACPGTDTCNLGLTSSRGLAHAIGEKLDQMGDLANIDGMSIKISGCPNSCGQHHIGSLGFYGNGKKVNGRLVPHVDVLVGGGWSQGTANLGKSVIKLPTKRVPEAVEWIVRTYHAERKKGQDFPSWAGAKDKGWWREKLTPFTEIGTFAGDREKYIDYESTDPFSLNDRGIGECAGAIFDMVTEIFNEADHFVFKGKQAALVQDWPTVSQAADDAVYHAARALLYTVGIDDKRRFEVGHKFIYNVIDKAVMEDKYQHLLQRLVDEEQPLAARSGAEPHFQQAMEFVEQCHKIQERASASGGAVTSLGTAPKAGGGETRPENSAKPYDLRGVACPMNFVKTKLRLEQMDAGERLEVWVDQGEPARNVPRSCEQEGHKILEQGDMNEFYRIVVEKA